VRTDDNNENNGLELLGTYQGHLLNVLCVMERDSSTLLTGSWDQTLKVWNTATFECLETIQVTDGEAVSCMLKTKEGSRFLCGLSDGSIETRRLSDLGLLCSLKIHNKRVWCLCELEDGSFVSVAGTKMKRWKVYDTQAGKVVQTYSGHQHFVNRVIELKRDLIVSASDDCTVKMWRVSTGNCLRTLTLHSGWVGELMKIKDHGLFVSGSCSDETIVVWDERGDCIETHKCKGGISAMTILRDGSIVAASQMLIEIWRP